MHRKVLVWFLSVLRVAGRVRRKLMAKRKAGAKTGRYALKSRSQAQGSASSSPVTGKRIVENLRYLNEEAFRSRTKK